MDEGHFLFEWLKHENIIFSNRVSFFLLVETALFIFIGTSSGNFILPNWAVFSMGLLITLIWLIVNFKHIYGTHIAIVNNLEAQKDHPWHKVRKERNYTPWSNNKILGILLPLVFLVLWIVCLIYGYKK